jgi:hypothetical protein
VAYTSQGDAREAIRYISNNLFNTPYGTDLFSNETELITDLNNLGDITTGVLFQINAKLANCDVSGGDVAIYTDTKWRRHVRH